MDNLDAALPRSRNYEIIDFNGEFGGQRSKFKARLRVNLSSDDECQEWISELNEKLRCQFNFRDKTTPKKANTILFRKYLCHLSRHNKKTKIATSDEVPNFRKRNYDCDASIYIWIRSGDDYALRNLAGEVSIIWEHSHDVETAHFLSLLRATKETKKKFLKYFDDDGLSAAEAMKKHKTAFDGDERGEEDRASQAFNPSRRTISYWYDTWRNSNFGQRLGSYEALTTKLSDYTNSGVIVLINENPFAVVIITPIMQRVHGLKSSAEISFVDSTSTCDVENHSITFMLAKTCVGAAPLAVFITSDQTEESYSTAFGLLKKALGEKAFGGRGSPVVFITDDSIAEKKGLAAVWPDSDLKNCIFHMAQANWRWLWVPNNSISMEHRQELMTDFRVIMFSPTDLEAQAAFVIATTKWENVYPNYVARLQKLWNRRRDWVIAYRDYASRGNFTNNFAEITVRLFKEIVLGRSKAYNAAALVDFVCSEGEAYYRTRLLDFAHFRTTNPAYLLMEKIMKKAAYVTSAESIIVQDDGTYLVPLESDGVEPYVVNTTLGYCGCTNGRFGKFCKHAAAVVKFYPQSLPNLPPISMDDRREMAFVAGGDRAKDPEFYKAMNEGAGPSGINQSGQRDLMVMDFEKTKSTISIGNIVSRLEKRQISEEEIEETMEVLKNTLTKYRKRANVAKAFANFSNQLSDCVNDPTRLSTLLSSAGKSRPKIGSKIPVNWVSITRRQGKITRGSGRMAGGRKANVSVASKLLKRARERRPNNLGGAIAARRPNATGHNVKSK